MKKVLALLLVTGILMSMCAVGVSATEERVIMTWDGEDSVTNLGGQDLSNVLDVVEFGGEKVINLNTNLAGVPVSGRAINYWTLTENKNLNKRMSFQVYVPSSSYYYVDMRLSSARHTVETIQSNQLNNISQFTLATDSAKERFIFGVYDGAGTAVTTKGITGLDMWHNVDIYINGKTVSYFVDYEHMADTNVICTTNGNYADGFDHAFKGFQMCVGQNGGTTGEEEGMYIRNITLSEVEPKLGSVILDDGFENYAVDTEVSDGIDVYDITSAISASSRYNNFVTVSNAWSATGAMGFKELSDGNKVFVARNVPDHPRVGSGTDLRFGFWRSNPVDLSRGDITIEFDINIPDRNKIWYLIAQPFAQNDSIGNLESQINVGGIDANSNDGDGFWNTTSSAKTAYASLVIPNKKAGERFNLRKDGQLYYGDNLDGNGSFYHSPAYKEGEWANVRFVISKVGEGSYRTKVYLNNGLIGEQSTAATAANAAQTQITDMVRGVRFMSVLEGRANPVTDLYYIDNLKMYLNEGGPATTYDVEAFKVTDSFGNVIGNTVNANSTSVEAGVIIAKNKAMSENLQVILAQYDENGVLTDCGLKEVGTKDAEIGSYLGGMVKENLSSTTNVVKAFLWTASTLQPIESKTMTK